PNSTGSLVVNNAKAVIFNGPVTMNKGTSINLGTSASLTCNSTVAMTDIGNINGTGTFVVGASSVVTSTNQFNTGNNISALLNNQGTININSGFITLASTGSISTGAINAGGGTFE